MSATVADIYRYPVKGLSAEALDRVPLAAREGLPGDRAYALARADAPFDPAAPAHLAKTHFLMLQRDEALARLATRFDPETGTLTVSENGTEMCAGRVTDPADRARIEDFFFRFMADALAGPPRLVSAPRHMFSDRAEKVVSIQNLASIAELGTRMGATVDPIRFRANVHLDGLPAWQELDWIGQRITIGTARLEVIDPIRRCAATMVNPATAERDLNIPKFLTATYGHMNMGIYARVIDGGEIARGDPAGAAT